MINFLEINPGTYIRRIDLKVIRDDKDVEELNIIDSNTDSVQAYLKKNPFANGPRVLLLGTSQLWGSGANSWKDRIEVQLQEELDNSINNNHFTYIINASKRASNSTALFERLTDHLFYFQPHLVVISLSNNDRDSTVFKNKLREIVEYNKRMNFHTLFVVEPNSVEIKEKRLKINHEIMRNVAEENNIYCLNLNEELARPEINNSGILWWDRVHLTSYGQHLAAGIMGEFIVENFDLSN
jgi:hypothetical protein